MYFSQDWSDSKDRDVEWKADMKKVTITLLHWCTTILIGVSTDIGKEAV